MATIYDYLDRLKEENPQYKNLSYRRLYKQLQGQDSNLPTWETKPTTGRKASKQDPSFMNSLFDWTDYGINETSAGFVRAAYNNSITGLAYQLHNGTERFDLSDYDPGIIEDVFSAVLSFSMPLDMASMFVGGYAGKLLTTPMHAGVKAKAIEKLVPKKAFTKAFGEEATKLTTQKSLKAAGIKKTSEQYRREIAEEHIERFVQDGGIASLYSKTQSKIAGAVIQGTTLATFEGVRGGFQAAVDGDDVWDGIGHGVMHGGIMGSIAGAVGASLNIKHGELLAKYAKAGDDVLSFSQKAAKTATGVVGQVGAEAGIFTAPELKNVMEDENYGMRELMRSFATNIGMMGVLKAKGKLWNKGKDEIGKWAEKEGLFEYIEAKELIKSVENAKKTVNSLPENTPAEKAAKKAALQQLSDFRNRQLQNAKVKVEEYEKWEQKFDEATKIIEQIDNGTIKDVTPEHILSVLRQIQAVRGAMELNKGRGKAVTDPNLSKKERELAKKERDAEIERLQKLEEQWKKEIEEPLEKWEKGVDPKVESIKQTRVDWKKSMEDAIKNKRTEQIKELREGLEEAVNEKGEIIDQAKFDKLADVAEINRAAYDKAYFKPPTPPIISDPIKKTKKMFEKEVDEQPSIDTKAKEIEKMSVSDRVNEKKLNRADKKIQEKEFENPDGDTTQGQIDAYKTSQKVMSWFARTFFSNKTLRAKQDSGTKLGHLNKLAEYLAKQGKEGKSFFEMTDSDFKDFIKQNPSITPDIASSMLRGLAKIGEINRNKGMEMFSQKLTLITGQEVGAKGRNVVKELRMPEKVEGAQIDTGEKDSSAKYHDSGKIEISSKTGFIEKFTHTNVIKSIKSLTKKLLRKAISGNTRSGHEGFLFRVKDGGDYVAIQHYQMNGIIRELAGRKNKTFPKGYARLFRKSINQWASEKFGADSAKADIVFYHITGHKPSGDVKSAYQKSKDRKEIEKLTKKIIEDYVKDIKNGKIDFGKSGEGFGIFELRKIQKELNKRLSTKEDNVFDVYNNKTKKWEKVTIDNATLETMYEYLLKTGPRLNEVGIKQEIFKEIESTYAKNQLESKIKAGENIVNARTLADQVKWVKQKFPRLSVKIEKTLGKHDGRFVLGKIHDHLIKIASGRAKVDTLPHEVSHHVVDVLKQFGDPISKKIIKDGIKLFKKKNMTEAQAEEAFVEALGKYTAKQLPKGMVGRMKSWVKRAVSYMRNYFGMRNKSDIDGMKKDIVRIIGGKVVKGKIPTDYLDLNTRLEVKYQTSGTPKGKKVIKLLRKQAEDLRFEAENTYNVPENVLKSIETDILGKNRTIKSSDVTGAELTSIMKNYKEMFNTIVQGKSSKFAANHSKVKDIEAEYNISESQRDSYFERFDVKFENASQKMIDSYKSYVSMGDKIKPLQDTITDAFKQISSNNISGTLPLWKRAFFKSADVIRQYSPKIARKLELHDFTRSFELKGPGERRVQEIRKIIKDKNVLNNYMHLIDPVLAKNAIAQLKRLSKDKNLSESQRQRFKSEYVKALSVREKFTNGEYVEASKIWKKTSDFYWFNLLNAIKQNSVSATEFKQIKDNLNERYIQEYFVRRPTREVAEFLHAEHSAIKKMAEKALKDLSLEELKKIEKMEGTPEDIIAAEIMNMLKFGPVTAKPSFLKERGVTLPEYIEIPTKGGGKKLVKSYESDIDATMSTYVNGMSKFISTVKHFPEFTELGGKFSLKNASSKAILEGLKEGKGTEDAIYAYETMKKQLGLDHNLIDKLNQPVSDAIGKITNISAVVGLSSPLAGIKNVLIQVPRSIAVYGLKNTYQGFTKAMRAIRNPDSMEWLKAVERGETGYGQKELLFGADKKIKWWFKNVNLMETTENLNRIMTAEAGRLHFAELVNAYRKGSSFFPKAKKAEIDRMFTDVFRLSKKQIKHLKESKDLHNSVEYENILNYVGFSAHKASAGATGVSDLPLWMSNKYMKPLTLFQRMAYSVTIDSYKNYVKPIKNGNIAPLLKATLGHMASGAALYGMYDLLMGQQIPTEENPPLDRAISNIWRGEMLGVFGEAISPYTARGNINPLMEPVVFRNIKSGSQEVINMLWNGKPVDMALKDFARQTIVIGAQAEKIWNKSTVPYAVNAKRIAALEKQWRKQMGSGYEQTSHAVFKKRSYAYRSLRNAISLNYSDKDIAKAYYVAYNTIINERISGGYYNMSENKKYADRAIMTMINKMNPLDISNERKGRLISKRREFLNYLSDDNKKLALNLEKEYQYKIRKFKRIIKQSKYRKLWANHL